MDIPGGAFSAGSTPGEAGRDPELEPRKYTVELGPYAIDLLPYPNDPARSPSLVKTRDEAKRACAERGARLCTELEWERACKGPASEPFATGKSWSSACQDKPNDCASGFGVLAMGSLLEWTASDVSPNDGARRAAVKGAPPDAAAPDRRCAHRQALPPDQTERTLGFRCCEGAPNAAVVREPKLGTTFEKLTLTAARVEKLFRSDPRTEGLAKDVKFFREPDATRTVIARGPGDTKGFDFTVSPLRWNPVAGAEYLLLSGRSGDKVSFVVAYYVLGDDEYQLAASFIMKDEPGPVAFAYSQYIRPRLHFSTCWGCPGETGKILHRSPDTVAILQP
ncbi:MAG TPA: hypothetical protein VKZ49_08295 [Polyangiaceae bacterium]|nr:hypothetical protein [Polyangiaceae bacterium]